MSRSDVPQHPHSRCPTPPPSVSVPTSMTPSTPSPTRNEMASARTSLPSLSVSRTSVDDPSGWITTSPGSRLPGPGRFSASGSTACTARTEPSRAAAHTAATTAAAAAISDFIQAISSGSRFRLIPPASKVIPFPARPSTGAGSVACAPVHRCTTHGGCALPRPTPSVPPKPAATSLSPDQISHFTPAADARSAIRSANTAGVRSDGGVSTIRRTHSTASAAVPATSRARATSGASGSPPVPEPRHSVNSASTPPRYR